MILRLLPHLVADGPANMGLDHALLDAVDAEPTAAVLRTYGWSEPTLSLGYFQPAALARDDPRWRGAPLVRRPSGGGALWHEHEVTYALVMPRAHAAARSASDLYRVVHRAIGDAIRAAGFPAGRRGDPEPSAIGERPFLCFADRDPEDLLLHGRKVVGSAQRRRPRAVLQHGSLLLARADTTPELPGLRELAGAGPDPAGWAGRLAAAIAGALGLRAEPGGLADSEQQAARALAGSTYRSDAWTFKR